MIDFMYGLMYERHNFIMNEEDVTTIVRTVNAGSGCRVQRLILGNCGWANEPDKWYMFFGVNNKAWSEIIRDLNNKGFRLLVEDEDEIHVERVES